jgi:hypothetical protein
MNSNALPFPLPSGMPEDARGIFQHAISGTGYLTEQALDEGTGERS